jgi:IS1 family transposase
VRAAKAIYNKVKKLRPNIIHLYSDANSCYDVAFAQLGVTEPHTMTKAETHLIEGSNSSICDNLARFNRRTKRYSKTISALSYAMKLFIYRAIVYRVIFI